MTEWCAPRMVILVIVLHSHIFPPLGLKMGLTCPRDPFEVLDSRPCTHKLVKSIEVSGENVFEKEKLGTFHRGEPQLIFLLYSK